MRADASASALRRLPIRYRLDQLIHSSRSALNTQRKPLAALRLCVKFVFPPNAVEATDESHAKALRRKVWTTVRDSSALCFFGKLRRRFALQAHSQVNEQDKGG